MFRRPARTRWRQSFGFRAAMGGIAGSMLIVMFTYAGVEIIGLASSFQVWRC